MEFSSEIPRILVYQLGSIGDTVVSIPALRAVRSYYGPTAKISLLHESHPDYKTGPPDLLRGSGLVDDFIKYPYYHNRLKLLASSLNLWKKLNRSRFDIVVYLAPSERTSRQVVRDEWFFRLCGIPRRVGFFTFPSETLYPVGPDGVPITVRHEALMRLDRLRLSGLNNMPEQDLSRAFLSLPDTAQKECGEWRKNHIADSRPLLAICPGGKKPSTHWRIDRFTEIGRRLSKLDRFELVIVGGPAEEDIGNSMIKEWGEGVNAAGKLSVLGSAALLGQCSLVIGLDTGTTHLASAQGVNCVVLFSGQGHPGRWDPLGSHPVLLRKATPCMGCGLPACHVEGHPCMDGISTDEVWDAVLRIIGKDCRPPRPLG